MIFLLCFFLFPSSLTPNNFRTAGSLKKHFFLLVRFSSSQIRTQDGWVRSANASAVLCRPPARACSYNDNWVLQAQKKLACFFKIQCILTQSSLAIPNMTWTMQYMIRLVICFSVIVSATKLKHWKSRAFLKTATNQVEPILNLICCNWTLIGLNWCWFREEENAWTRIMAH